MRLDEAIVNRKLLDSRNKAKEFIKNGKVSVNGKIINKPSFKVEENDILKILEDKIYVSRAAWKLKNYLEKYGIDFCGKLVLDIGASTGGFSEVSLEKGARKVVAVDVGSNQLHPKLKNRVESYENTDIRDFEYKEKFDVIVSDVSFISLLKILNKIDSLAKRDIILLFKPQFEVGRDVSRNKKGVVLDIDAIKKARDNFENEAGKLGWKLLRSEESSVRGKEGNVEYVYHFVKKLPSSEFQVPSDSIEMEN